jgi:hypothetical protein
MTQPFDNRDWDVRQLELAQAELARLRALVRRAADALEPDQNPVDPPDYAYLIAELRKAAE